MSRWTIVVALIACAVGVVIGYGLEVHRSAPVWISGQAHVSVQGHVATFSARNWRYGIRGSVPWYDSAGSFHDSGWPSCLTDQTSTVRFEATQQTVNSIKVVLAVDCR